MPSRTQLHNKSWFQTKRTNTVLPPLRGDVMFINPCLVLKCLQRRERQLDSCVQIGMVQATPLLMLHRVLISICRYLSQGLLAVGPECSNLLCI
jgi:hypothetical protein